MSPYTSDTSCRQGGVGVSGESMQHQTCKGAVQERRSLLVFSEPYFEKNSPDYLGAEVRRDWKPQISLEFSGPWFPPLKSLVTYGGPWES